MVESLECDLELLCLTGVEDKLQTNVKQTLELLRNAGLKVKCVKFSSDLFMFSPVIIITITQELHNCLS